MASAPVQSAQTPAPSRILVIDDDAVMCELLEAVLSLEGHTVETAESGEAALLHLRSGPTADVILTDVQLPGLSGPALAKQIRRVAPEAVLLGMSGSEPGGEVRAAFDAFLLKPFSPEDFAAAVIGANSPGVKCSSAARGGAAPEEEVLSSGPAPLDEATCARLAASLPAAQLAELYQLTLDDISSRLIRMREIETAGDITEYRREAHALKGGCSMVGATEMAALAARAEVGSFGDTPALTDFVAAAERLRSILTARFMHNS